MIDFAPVYAVTALWGDERVWLRPVFLGRMVLNEFQAVPFTNVYGPLIKASYEAALEDERLSGVTVVTMDEFGHRSRVEEKEL